MILANVHKGGQYFRNVKRCECACLVTRFLSKRQSGTDIRCFVIGDKVVATMQRIGKDGEFRANFHRGGTAEKLNSLKRKKSIAIRATKASGLAAGVDLIFVQKKGYWSLK